LQGLSLSGPAPFRKTTISAEADPLSEIFNLRPGLILGFEPPQACHDGIRANLDLLAQHARVLLSADGPAGEWGGHGGDQ